MTTISGWWWGGISYSVCHLAHVLIWRFAPVRRDVKALFFLFIVGPASLFAVSLLLNLNFTWAAGVFHFALAANYIAIYPAFQASSPTLTILDALYRRNDWADLRELVGAVGGEKVLSDRVEDLKRSGLTTGESQLTAKGNFLSTIFITYRQLIGLPEGGG